MYYINIRGGKKQWSKMLKFNVFPAILYMRDWGVFANHDCPPDAIKRSHGELGDSVIKYSYDSEALGKSVSIEFQYAKPENGSEPSDGDENV